MEIFFGILVLLVVGFVSYKAGANNGYGDGYSAAMAASRPAPANPTKVGVKNTTPTPAAVKVTVTKRTAKKSTRKSRRSR